MKATIVKKYDLDNDEIKALEMTKEILESLRYEGFEDEFYDSESVCLVDAICVINSVLDNDGADWV